MAIAPQIQQRLPFVDAQGRLTNDGLRALNDALRDIVSAIDSAVAAQQSADTAQDQAIDAATEAANAALAATAAQSTADDAASLAATSVQQDVGPAWAAATGTASRATFTTYAGQTVSNPPTQAEVQAIDDHVKALSERMKALIDDLQGNGALT